MTYDVTQNTFYNSFALSIQANFAAYFENSRQINHPDFSKMAYPVQF